MLYFFLKKYALADDLPSIQLDWLMKCPYTRSNLVTRVITQSQIPLGTDKKNTIFALFWPENPSNLGGKLKNSDFYHYMFPKQVVSVFYPRFMRVGICRYISEICLFGPTCSNWSLVLYVCLSFILPLLLLTGWSPLPLGLISSLAEFTTSHMSAWNCHGSPRF